MPATATITQTYQIQRDVQAVSAQQALIESIVLNQGELLPLALTKTSDATTYVGGVFNRQVVMTGGETFLQQFPTTTGQRSAVNNLFTGRLERLGMVVFQVLTTIVITP